LFDLLAVAIYSPLPAPDRKLGRRTHRPSQRNFPHGPTHIESARTPIRWQPSSSPNSDLPV